MIADAVQRILDKCSSKKKYNYVRGYIYHPDGWNVQVRKDKC
jgi:hypothetical protein